MTALQQQKKKNNNKKAILITYPLEQASREAISLADAVGYSVIRVVTQRQITRSRYGIGKGKAEEVKSLVEELKPDVIIFDEVLKPSQMYNLASLCKVEIVDRERLILEIFELRASTAESRIQIRLAQLRYELTRARDKVRLAKRGEQPGFFGLGKYEADVYFLDIRRHIAILKKKLEKEEKKRQLFRTQRTRSGLPTVSLAGYTSAGKTTLFNAMTGECKVTGQGLFTTLSTFTRAIQLDSGYRVLINDTVGFISKLPAYMIEAFKSTLDELRYANLILLVLDISEPVDEVWRKYASSLDVINEFEVPPTRIIYVLNKVDSTSLGKAFDKAGEIGILDTRRVIPVSAKTGLNMDRLRDMIQSMLFKDSTSTSSGSNAATAIITATTSDDDKVPVLDEEEEEEESEV
ncbi:MAG TPA: GTPase HflX [Nitrososphaera sp.]|nr:GTPase HflX [Nitrososphaera sp.]